MKRLFLALVVVLLTASVVCAATPGFRLDPGTGDILGQGKYQSDAHKIFRMVRFVQTGTPFAGRANITQDSVVIWDLRADDGVTVTTTTKSFDSAVAGIIVQECLTQETEGNTAVQDRGKRNWSWLQTLGLSECYSHVNPSTAGDALGTSETPGAAASFLPSASTSGINGNAGFFYDDKTDGASSTDVECFIRLD